MQKNDSKLSAKNLVTELAKYSLIGGTALMIDTSILFAMQQLVFYGLGKSGVMLSTLIGFVVAFLYHYIMSVIFVFKDMKTYSKREHISSLLAFIMIGLIGLGLTEAGMFLGTSIFGLKYYIFVKIVVAAVVLVWNYSARKLFLHFTCSQNCISDVY